MSTWLAPLEFLGKVQQKMRLLRSQINRNATSTSGDRELAEELERDISLLGIAYISASDNAEEVAQNLAIANQRIRVLERELGEHGMPENMFRNLLDEIGILVEEASTGLEPLEPRDLVRVVFKEITEEPYRSWCEQWRIGDYPVYLKNL